MATSQESPGPAEPGLSGRKAEASRNDGRILEAARDVFVANPEAPIAAVAERAGVGISALYRRYASKDELLRTLCWGGLRTYIAVVETALDDQGDAWEAFTRYMEEAVDADTSSLTQKLAGTFTSVEEMWHDANRANQLSNQLIERTQNAGALRDDIEPNDVALIFEQLAAINLGDRARTMELRRRYLAMHLQALRAPTGGLPAEPLPGSAPTWQEISQRWAQQ